MDSYFLRELKLLPLQNCGTSGKEPTCQCRRLKRRLIRSLGREDPLEEGVATHSDILAWRIPWTEDPGGLYSPWGHKESDMNSSS